MLFIILFFILTSNAYSYDIKTVNGKAKIIQEVACSSCAAIPDVEVPEIDKAIIDEMNLEDKMYSRTDFLNELNKRKSVDYNLEKIREEKNKIDFYKGIGKSTGTYQAEYNKYNERYDQVK